MPGKRDLKDILENLHPLLVDESYVFMTSREPIDVLVNSLNPVATFTEIEGSTLVITKAIADENSVQYDTVFNCISLGVHSSLEASGLIATISGELFKNNIPANVFAGYFHDHIFIPIEKAKFAIEIISSIRSS